jgi:hypothetical protein
MTRPRASPTVQQARRPIGKCWSADRAVSVAVAAEARTMASALLTIPSARSMVHSGEDRRGKFGDRRPYIVRRNERALFQEAVFAVDADSSHFMHFRELS